MKTLVVGHITHDYYAREIVAGGCAYYGALVHTGLSSAGDSVHLCTVVGEDFSCHAATRALDLTMHQAGNTTVFMNEYPPDAPRVQLLKACAGEVTPDLVDPVWLKADLVHLAPVLGEVDLKKWTRAVKAARPDALVAINIQGWIKIAGPETRLGSFENARRVVQRYWNVQCAALEGVDIACLSEEDIIDQPGLLEKLIANIPFVAFTRGEKGSVIYHAGEAEEVGIYPTTTVDPTGAGDVFAASFANRIARGDSPGGAGRFAAAVASLVVEDIGARGLAGLDKATEELNERVSCIQDIPHK